MERSKVGNMTFDEWLQFGIDNGFCTDQYCSTHDSGPMHESEEQAWENGWDPCHHVVRLGSYEDWNVGDDS